MFPPAQKEFPLPVTKMTWASSFLANSFKVSINCKQGALIKNCGYPDHLVQQWPHYFPVCIILTLSYNLPFILTFIKNSKSVNL